MKNNDILVSVICLAYNHEKYIEKALEGFIMQKTNFSYEVIIHDDASTDNTAAIIRKYEERFPDIILGIYQEENQYSKGENILSKYIYPRAKGKYIAYCEGDDFWLYENKLQEQVDYMEQNQGCTLCIHNAITVDQLGNKISDINSCDKTGVVPTETVIDGGGGFCATNSIVTYKKLMVDEPKCFKVLSIDLVWQMYLSSCGYTYCFETPMSAYRVNVENSWTDVMKRNKSSYVEHMRRVINVYNVFDNETKFKFHEVIKKKIIETEFRVDFTLMNVRDLISKKYVTVYCDIIKNLSLSRIVVFAKRIIGMK